MVSLKGIMPSKDDFGLALGAATAGMVTGLIQGFIPINLEFVPGATQFIVGLGLKKFLLKGGLGGSYAKGVMICGLSNMIASFIPQFAGTFPGAKQATLGTMPDGYPLTHAQAALYPRQGVYVQRSPGVGVDTFNMPTIAPRGTQTIAKPAPHALFGYR